MVKNNSAWYLALIVAVIQLIILLWQTFYLKVPNYHLLHDPELPSVSNWWNLLVLPLMTLICLKITQTRILKNQKNHAEANTSALIGLVFAFNFGATVAGSYHLGMTAYVWMLLAALPIVSLFVRIYHAECILGLVFSISFVFGALSSLCFALCVAIVGYVLYTTRQLVISHVRHASKIRRV